jgi:hypothetical protein
VCEERRRDGETKRERKRERERGIWGERGNICQCNEIHAYRKIEPRKERERERERESGESEGDSQIERGKYRYFCFDRI